jgi:Peptidase family M48
MFELTSRDVLSLDKASESYLSEMMQRLIKAEGVGALPMVPLLQIAQSEQPLALSTPSYSIIVSQGLLQRLSNEEELAFVLAHELCHFRLAHFNNRESSDYALETELEADRCAVKNLFSSNYALHAAPRILAELHGDTTPQLRKLGRRRLEAITQIIHHEDQGLWYPADHATFQKLKQVVQIAGR